ncbi:hypothetical protein ACS15_1575 [Ralstonia insidiosa]|uniref:Uncharacterized protein n=1 Tax=Ralstonia insidiosa TaxID=190721 RepID=A0AAC9BDU6_9RALS|nr:hypothetical protein ACS15_1575 [Ralstonia insidiosa]
MLGIDQSLWTTKRNEANFRALGTNVGHGDNLMWGVFVPRV